LRNTSAPRGAVPGFFLRRLAFLLAVLPLFVLALRGEAKTSLQLLSAAPVTTTVFQRVSEAYLDPSRFDYGRGLKEALRSIEALIPEFQAGYEPGAASLKAQMNQAQKSFDASYLNSIPALLDILKKVYGFIQKNLKSDVDPADIDFAAINGFLSILDPHSRLLPPSVYKEFQVTTSGAFGGLGIQIGLRENHLTVISPVDGTPADRAGLRANDRIVRIEDESTENMPLDEAVKRLRGPEGTVVHLTLLREGEPAPLEFALTRARIEIPSVEGELLPGGVGFVRVSSFQENTAHDLGAKLSAIQAEAQGPDRFQGLILDLRNNPGGLLDQAIQVADLFLSSGDIVSTVTRTARKTERAHQFRTERTYPMVILVNEGSASASEIVAGALKNHNRALIVGARTFGKGSVQNVFDLPLNAALKLTVAQYLTPGDQSIQSVGVLPNVRLVPVALTKDEVRMEIFGDAMREEDLDAHLTGAAPAPDAKPDAELQYLVDLSGKPGPGEDGGEETLPSGKRKVDLEKDFPVALSRKAILGSKAWQRQSMIEANRTLFSSEGSRQNQLIVQALSQRGYDWSAGQSAAPASIEAKIEVLGPTGKPQASARSGEKESLRLKVTNRGRAPLYRLRATTKTDIPFLGDREFVFGKLAPGASAQQKIPFEIPLGELGRSASIEVTFWADDHAKVAHVSDSVTLTGAPRPAFALSYKLLDGAAPGTSGNSDGAVNPGETVALQVSVENRGQGASAAPTVRLRNLDAGPFLDIPEGQGTVKFKDLLPKASASGTLYFSIKPGYTEASAPLEISVVDPEFAAGLAQKFRIPLVRPDAPIPPAGELQSARQRNFSPPAITLATPAPAGLVSTAASLPLAGDIEDDERVKDLLIMVNGDKVFYQSYEGAAAARLDRFKFHAQLPLKEGMNFVLVIARDGDDLSARYPLFVWRAGSQTASGEQLKPGPAPAAAGPAAGLPKPADLLHLPPRP